jgi:hypothetical protein
VIGLQSALQEAQSRAIRLLADTGPRPPPPPPENITKEEPPPPSPPGEVVVEERPFGSITAAEAVVLLDGLPGPPLPHCQYLGLD